METLFWAILACNWGGVHICAEPCEAQRSRTVRLTAAPYACASYGLGGWATMPFSPPSPVPISGTTVTSVSYQWSTYPNGNSSELVEICYSNPYSSTIQYCHNISASQTGTVHFYDGFSARGTFWIRHTLTGDTYPATANSRTDSVTVNYHY